MKTKFTLWKRAARSVLLVLLLSAAGLTKSLAQEWQTLTLNDGTDLNEYVPFYGQFSSEYPTYSQFIIPATDLTEMATGGVIRSMTFHNSDYYLSWGGYDYNVYDYRDGQFEVRVKEVPFDKFDNDYYPQNDLYDWENMDLFFEGSLMVSDYQMTIWYNNVSYSDNGYYYGGGNLLIGIKPITVYQTNSCSWYGINESVEEWGVSPSASFNNNSGFLYFKPKLTLEYRPVPSLTVNDGTDLKSEFFPQSEGATCQFVIPAYELGDLSWNYIKALTLYCNYEEYGEPYFEERGEGEIGTGGTRTAPDWSDCQFEVRVKEVNFQSFDYNYEYGGYQLYDWEAMTLVYQGGLFVSNHKVTIPFNVEPYNFGYQYGEGSNLLVGIRLVSINYNYYYYWNGTFSLYGINEDWPCTSLYSQYGDGYVYTPNFKPKVSFGYEEGYAPSCLKPQYLQANKQVHYATISWTSDAPTFNLQYKKSSEEWDEGHWDYDENWNWVWFEGTTNVVEGLTETQYTIDSLDFKTSYDVRVQAVCNEWDVSDWASISFTTIKPVAPTNLTATNLNTPEANSATLQWNYDLSYEYPTYWDIAYTPLQDAQPDDVDFITIDATPGNSQVSYVLTDLVPFTAYKAWVRASFGNDEVSDWDPEYWSNILFTPTNMIQVVLNEGDSLSSKVPCQMYQSSNSNVSKSQFIIPASSLVDFVNHEIWSMGFGVEYNTWTSNWYYLMDIYLAEVEMDQITTTEYYDWDNMELVYHGTFDRWGFNTSEMKFSSPYYYEGGNLLVGINAHYRSNNSYNWQMNWKGIQTESYVALASMNDSVPEQIAFLPTATFSYTPSNCHSPHDLAVVVSDDETSATLSWTCEETNCRLCYWTQTNPTPVYVDVTGNSYELINLPKNTYYWKVQSLCSGNVGSRFVDGPSFLNVVVKEPAFSNNTYEIYTTGELKWIEGVTNGTITTGTEGVFPTGNRPFAGLTVKLMNDLDLFGLNWKPIGTGGFGGIFDGNGHSINNLHINTNITGGYNNNNVGLFARLASGGTIHDVNLGGVCSIDSYRDYVGGIVGQIVSGGEIYNIGINGEFSVTGSSYVGGIVGSNSGTVHDVSVGGEFSVTGSSYVGGIVGSNSGTVHDISVGGEFSVIGRSSVGGIAGSNQSGEIYNAGIDGVSSVTGKTDNYCYECGWYVGGIVGRNIEGIVQNVYNNATVSGNSYVGGIVGETDYTGYNTPTSTIVQNVYNNASVNGNDAVGGIVGYNRGTISQAYSKGEITAQTNAGGIVGLINNGTMTNTYNRGDITASDGCAGGIVGAVEYSYESISISYSYSTGYLHSSGDWGPIVGSSNYHHPFHNNYFLKSVGFGNHDWSNDGTWITQENMQSQAFVDALNTSQTPQPWKADFVPNTNDGYPILQWQNLMHTVTYTRPEHGYLTVKNGNLTVTSGTHVADSTVLTVTATPYYGYALQSLTANGVEIEDNTLVVTEAVQIEAIFVPQQILVYNTIVDDSIFLIGDTIPIHGTVKNGNNVPVANVDVEIGVTVFGNRRTLETVSDENGEFAVDFIPSSFESGYYTVNSGPIGNADTTAVHDDFDILGMMIGFVENEADTIHYNGYIVCEVTQNDPPKPFVLPVKNKNSIALTNLHVEIISEQPEGSVFNFGTLNLAGFEFGYLPFTVSGTVPTQGDVFQEFMVRVISNEGSKIEFTIMYYCHEATPELNAYPNPIVTTVTRGKSKTLDVTLTNNGTVASGEITVNLPDLEWMSVMDGTTLPSINAGQSSIFTLRLSPDNEVPLGLYEGTIVINTSSGSYVNLSYSITVVSEEEGILLVDVTDEYTTNTNNGNGPHVEGAEVTLTDYYSHETVAHGFTSSTGIFGAEDIPEGWYYLEVDADRHLGYNEIVYISAGTTNRYDIFLPYQGVYFSWSVEETEIIDEYLIELNVEYETDVPVPVLVIDGPSYIPAFESYYDYSFVITNHGLIDATDLTIIPENEMYYLTPLFTYIDTLHAHQSIVVPCRVTHKDPEDCGNWEKTVVQYKYLSGQTKISKSSFTYTLIGGQPCDDELPYLGDGDSGSGFGNNSPRPKPRPRPNGPNNSNGGNSSNHHSTPPITHQNPYVSVRFGVQFSQNMTMTREAFIGTFIVYNNEPSATTDIGLDLTVKDELGIDHTNLFEITVTSMDGIDAIDGTGTMSAASNGMVKIQFIPTRGAAPTEPVDYYFGGNFTFTDPQTSVSHTMHLYPTKITVHPSPDLHLDYFVSPVLYGDNPLTPNVIEPSVPAELAVRIKNVGVGTAKNVMIETAEPVIVNNIQNLLIEINHIGTYVDGEGVQLGLHNIDFGNIESGQIKEGEWLFTSSLLARLISGNVHLVHNDVYGDPRLSLVSHIGIHELTHPIYGSHGTRTTGAHDLLVNDIPDENNYPDSIYFSNGGKTSVSVIESASFDKYVTSHDTIVTLTVNPSRIGWNYGETEDPGRNHYELVSCTRNNDNQIISLSNIWQESMLVPNSGDSLYENKLRFVDTLSVVQPVTYTLVYAGIPSDPYIFFGDDDEYWSNAANWESNVKPYSPSNNVLIDGICQLDEDVVVSSLAISEGRSLTIPSGKILTTSGTLTSEATSRLVVEDGGQLVHGNAGVLATVKKSVTPYTPGQKNGWHLIASPLASTVNVSEVQSLTNVEYDLYYYDEPTVYWINHEDASNNFTELENGKGYLYGNNQEINLGFVGELQNGTATVSIPLVYTTGHALQGFNLVGNPFAHNVTSYASVNVANGCYVMNEAKDDLIVSEISEANPLKPAEGFFVKATAADASITFNPQRGNLDASDGTIRLELAENNKVVDRLLVKTVEGQPLEKLSLNEHRTKLFAQGERQELAIVPCEGNEQIVNFKAAKNGTYAITVNADGLEFNYLHLVDNLTGADVDLLVEPNYTFEARTSDYASRFLLRFIMREGGESESENFVYIFNDKLVVANEGKATLQVIDLLGHVLSSEQINGSCEKQIVAAPGVYVLRLVNGKDVKMQKIVVR